MKSVANPRPIVGAPQDGVAVTPDRLLIPIRIEATGASSLLAASSLADKLKAVQAVTTEAVEPSNYTSWIETIAGKMLRGHGTRHHARADLVISKSFEPEASFFDRVLALETLRTALMPLHDANTIHLGSSAWRVSDPERFRTEATAHLTGRVQETVEALGVQPIHVRGDHALTVTVTSPTRATISLDLDVELGAVPSSDARS